MGFSLKKKLALLTRTDPHTNAESAGLLYSTEEELCITRKRRGKGFIYFDGKKEQITDADILLRFRLLVIPPAWEKVKICLDENGHIQATGFDKKGRKQYLYHPKWDAIRNQTKFYRMIKFAGTLPLIRERVEEDLKSKNLTKEKVLALVVRLLGETLIRIGNREYADKNDSYGLTTLRDRHLKTENGKPKFQFKGKSGKEWNVDISNKKLARIVKQCQEVPGQHLFQYYTGEGDRLPLSSTDVNQYLKEISGEDFTAKDFRTWGASALALQMLMNVTDDEETSIKKTINNVIKETAAALTNTVAICRKYYIHPLIMDSYSNGTLLSKVKKFTTEPGVDDPLSSAENALLHLLKENLKSETG